MHIMMKGGIYQDDIGVFALLFYLESYVKDLLGKIWVLMISNPYLTLFVAASLIPIGVSLFRSIKRAARR